VGRETLLPPEYDLVPPHREVEGRPLWEDGRRRKTSASGESLGAVDSARRLRLMKTRSLN
jgi:hypothetical protein